MTGGVIYNVPATVTKLHHKGLNEIVVLKNFRQAAFMKNLNYYNKSSVYSLIWNKIGFYPVWKIKSVSGYSAGFSIFKENGGTYLADAIVANPGSFLSKPESYIIVYKLP